MIHDESVKRLKPRSRLQEARETSSRAKSTWIALFLSEHFSWSVSRGKKKKAISKSPQVTSIPRGLRTLTLSPEGLPVPSEDLAVPGPWSDGGLHSLPARAAPLTLWAGLPFRLHSEAPCVGCELHECSQSSLFIPKPETRTKRASSPVN